MLGKAQDTMSPVGPTIVPRQFLDGTRANFALSVNGLKKQTGNTADMIYSLPEQIAGVGLPRGEKLKPGDTVRIEADLIGSMEVVIR
jgi:2-keto-4-pentenoate hydratase/2-oxohepta-3-ene-1,7-dioic acid hydratase in catechol pathway